MSSSTETTIPPDPSAAVNDETLEPIHSKEQAFVPEVNLEEPQETTDDLTHDGPTNSTARTNTRLVKFQLYETKAVYHGYFRCLL